MKINLIAGLLLLVISLTVEASDWRVVAWGNGNVFVYVDASSISKKGKWKKAWFRYDYESSQTTDSAPFKQYLSSKELDYFDCGEKTTAIAQTINYSGKSGSGEVVSTYTVPVGMYQFSDVTPDTIGESMFNHICGRK